MSVGWSTSTSQGELSLQRHLLATLDPTVTSSSSSSSVNTKNAIPSAPPVPPPPPKVLQLTSLTNLTPVTSHLPTPAQQTLRAVVEKNFSMGATLTHIGQNSTDSAFSTLLDEDEEAEEDDEETERENQNEEDEKNTSQTKHQSAKQSEISFPQKLPTLPISSSKTPSISSETYVVPLYQPVNLTVNLRPSRFYNDRLELDSIREQKKAFSTESSSSSSSSSSSQINADNTDNQKRHSKANTFFATVSVVPCHSSLHQQAIERIVPRLNTVEGVLDRICDSTLFSSLTEHEINSQEEQKSSDDGDNSSDNNKNNNKQPSLPLFEPEHLFSSFPEALTPTELLWNGLLHGHHVSQFNPRIHITSQHISASDNSLSHPSDIISTSSSHTLQIKHNIQFVFLVAGEYDLRCRALIYRVHSSQQTATAATQSSSSSLSSQQITQHTNQTLSQDDLQLFPLDFNDACNKDNLVADVEYVIHVCVMGTNDNNVLFSVN